MNKMISTSIYSFKDLVENISIGFDEEWYKDVENQMRNLIVQYRYTDAIASPAIYSPETKEYKQLNKLNIEFLL